MTATPKLAVTEIKAFVPAKDFAVAMAFYEALGFTRASVFDGIAYFHIEDRRAPRPTLAHARLHPV
jgi:hypothetical protein